MESALDPKRQEQARTYARIRRRLMVIDLAIGAFYTLAWLLFGWSAALKSALLHLFSNELLLVAGFGAIFGGLYSLISLPLSYYSGYALPHRFGLSTQSIKGWIGDQFKGLLVIVLVGGLLVEVVYAVLRAAPETWWLWAAGMMLLFNVLLANLAPILIAPLFFKFEPLEKEHAELAERLTRLAERANIRVNGVFKFDMSRRTSAANAALFGLGRTRRVILGDTLVKGFTADEIETILAHELGHHAHRDIPVGIVANSLITLIGFYLASLGLKWGTGLMGLAGPSDVTAMPLLALILGAFEFITLPVANAYSRWRERRADQYALRLTRNGEAFASALTRLANQNLSDADPEPWVEFLLYSHPASSKRIAMAKSAVGLPAEL